MSLQVFWRPSRLHCLWHSCKSQSPVRFLISRMDPSAPPSLVNPRENARSEVIGSRSSTPIKLQVPLLMKALLSFISGIAATALAVSCEATATTGKLRLKPVSRRTSARTGPNCVPGTTTSGRMRIGISSLSNAARAQPLVGEYIWVVVASVCSTTRAPHRKK